MITKDFIKDVLSVPSCSGHEEMLRDYILKYAADRGIGARVDAKGNAYLCKGKVPKGEFYPCLANHMDTVQNHEGLVRSGARLAVREWVDEGRTKIYAEGTGIGADDKLGCALALAIIDELPAVKAVFFVEEELCMMGSKQLDERWFDDVGFCLSFDSPERNRSAMSCSGVDLFGGLEGEFFRNVLKPVAAAHGVTEFRHEPFTDVLQVREKTGVKCWNLGNGGRLPHSPVEYLVYEDAVAAYETGLDLLRRIGSRRW